MTDEYLMNPMVTLLKNLTDELKANPKCCDKALIPWDGNIAFSISDLCQCHVCRSLVCPTHSTVWESALGEHSYYCQEAECQAAMLLEHAMDDE